MLSIVRHADIVVFALRILLGTIFLAHGSQKLFGLLGGSGLEGFATFLAKLNVPTWLAYGAALSELIGGCLLVFGIATEIGALMVAGVMLGAIYLVHWPHGFFIQNNGFEYSLTLLILSILVILAGPGKWYLWNPFKG